ncbi:Spastin [Hordeum vulgare]|uniref:AAA+ ATPase domain-containing protein n=1 Tax=Hordeum vulgare subsp. vulgare TaxID=112509 RepID=A0A8I6XUW5_HORVV|nr:peroxisomal biogenesis factor 6-like isoform X2 [Hordeum vulgare subsp. vulgare]KAE8815669.1 Spastin [Hordeum vulgare]
MEHGSLLASAVTVGVGVGIGLVSARLTAASTPHDGGVAGAEVEAELRRLVVDGVDIGVTFDDFPYYLSEETKLALTSAGYAYLSKTTLPSHIRVLSAASRTILLCGPSEPYLQSLAKALAHHFDARLMLLDIAEFSRQIQHKYGSASSALVRKRSLTESALDKVSGLVGSFNFFRKKDEPEESLKYEKNLLDLRTSNCTKTPSVRVHISLLPAAFFHACEPSEDFGPIRQSWNLDEKILIKSLYKLIASVSECNPVIIYIRDVNLLLGASDTACSLFKKMLSKLSGRVLIIGSYFLESDEDSDDVDEVVSDIFPCVLETKPPKEEADLVKWKTQIEEDTKKTKGQIFTNMIAEVLSANSLICDDLDSLDPDEDLKTIASYMEEIMAPAVSYHLMDNKVPKYRNGKLVIPSESLSHGLRIFQESSSLGKDTVEPKDVGKKVTPDNEFEKLIRPTVVPASQIGVTFDDIGALTDIKESLQELVMLPLKRPELFNGGLLKPCKGILLFGPPGTGKTMLAKALANEAGASFLNISLSTIMSKYYGDAEKTIRALFSLATKLAPAIIFVDEVDSLLGQRDQRNENELPRRIKNEFMTHWDGLLSNSNERILVLAATNRPFDLDEAIVRRFEHRIMVGLPTLESRELILKKLLSKEKVEEGIDFKELATSTEGYSGSDLKNLCVTAAYRPVRELIQKEQQKEKDKKENVVKVKEPETQPKNQESAEQSSESKKCENVMPETKQGETEKTEKGVEGATEDTVTLRPLTMEDLRLAKDQVGASLASEGSIMTALKEWNELYGKGGSRKKEQLSYFF